jgi:hypothetical protein
MSYIGYTPLDTADNARTEPDSPQSRQEALAEALLVDPGVDPLSKQGLYVSTMIVLIQVSAYDLRCISPCSQRLHVLRTVDSMGPLVHALSISPAPN